MSESVQSPRMRAPEVCAVLLCSRDHLYKLHKRGLLHKYNDGKRFAYWLREEVMAYARQCRHELTIFQNIYRFSIWRVYGICNASA